MHTPASHPRFHGGVCGLWRDTLALPWEEASLPSPRAAHAATDATVRHVIAAGSTAQAQAAMGPGDGEARPREARGSARVDLGWCAGNTVQPKRQRVIQGVGTASLVSLQAQLYAAQEAGIATGGAAPPRARGPRDALGSANPGVLDRVARDVAAAAVATDVHGALERKAALYDQLAREGVTDPRDERFEVDFFSKARTRSTQAKGQFASADSPSLLQPATLTAVSDAAQAPPGDAVKTLEAAEEQRRREQRGIIQELAHETAAARSQNAAAMETRAASATAQREALKASFVARLRAAKATAKQQTS